MKLRKKTTIALESINIIITLVDHDTLKIAIPGIKTGFDDDRVYLRVKSEVTIAIPNVLIRRCSDNLNRGEIVRFANK